jgi:hypothetical protein
LPMPCPVPVIRATRPSNRNRTKMVLLIKTIFFGAPALFSPPASNRLPHPAFQKGRTLRS